MQNRSDISNKDLLTLLSFADKQEHVLRRFGVDTTVITELSKDLSLQYCNTTQVLMKQWMHRIADADEKAEVLFAAATSTSTSLATTAADTLGVNMNVVARGQITHWPEDLMKCMGEQLRLIHSQLQDDARDSVSLLIIKLLPEFIKKHRSYLDHLVKNAETTPHCIEKLCAYVNNNRRFVELLREREMVSNVILTV